MMEKRYIVKIDQWEFEIPLPIIQKSTVFRLESFAETQLIKGGKNENIGGIRYGYFSGKDLF